MDRGSQNGDGSATIVCGVSRSRQARRVAGAAADLAAGLGNRLVLTHVVIESATRIVRLAGGAATPAERRDAEAFLADLVAGDPSLERAEGKIESGATVASVLAAAAERCGAELLVIGAGSSASFASSFGPSLPDVLAEHAPCPVVVVPARAERFVFLPPPLTSGGTARPRARESS